MKKDNKNKLNSIKKINEIEYGEKTINNDCIDIDGIINTSFFVVLLAAFFSFVIHMFYISEYSITYNLPEYNLNISATKLLWVTFFIGGIYIISNILVFIGSKKGLNASFAKIILILYGISICFGMVNFAKELPFFKTKYEFVSMIDNNEKFILIDNNDINNAIGMKYEMDERGNVTILADSYCYINITETKCILEYKELKHKPKIKK